MAPHFYVVARVIGAPGTFKKWEEVLVNLVQVSATEPKGVSYYWSQDLDGEPDTIWGLEGYTDSEGFFVGHPSSDVFKTQMEIVDKEKLLAADYDVRHYNYSGGWLKRQADPNADSKTGHVAVIHFFTAENKRSAVTESLKLLATETLGVNPAVLSCAVFEEINDSSLVTLWVRTKTPEAFSAWQNSAIYRSAASQFEGDVVRTEIHQSRAFNGHLEIKSA